jgi:drug/metabolite transporter (DMT)-like permease
MNKEKIGILCGILAALSYVCLTTSVKFASSIANETLIFFRSFICFILIIPFFAKKNLSIKTKRPFVHLARALVGLITLYLSFYATKNLYLVDAVLLYNTIPLFIPFVLFIGLKTKISRKRLLAACIGFLGVISILKPSFQCLNLAGMIGLSSGILGAIVFVIIQQLAKTDPSERIVFYFFLLSMILSFFPMIFSWQTFDPKFWIYIILIGLFAFSYQFLITKAYAYVSATKISLSSYLAVVFSVIPDWIFWGKLPDFWTIFGALFVFLGASMVILDKQKIEGTEKENEEQQILEKAKEEISEKKSPKQVEEIGKTPVFPQNSSEN